MKIIKTECLLNSKLPNTHACSLPAQPFCPNPFLWVIISEKTCNKLIFSFLPAYGLISFQRSLMESNKLNFIMKQHFEFLPTKSELATANNN